MQATRRYNLFAILRWQSTILLGLLVLVSVPSLLHHFLGWSWMIIPWQPLSLIGIALAFYLGFKNNSSYDRLWEARKIWGGIVNASRSFTVMARDFLTSAAARDQLGADGVKATQTALVHRQVAWLHALDLQMRKLKAWEHFRAQDTNFREFANTSYAEHKFSRIQPYVSESEYEYLMTKGNKASHLLALQSKHIMQLRDNGLLDGFLHQQLQGMITEFYTLMGKSERIKNFPFPRQYAGVNYYFVALFVLLLPFGMFSLFAEIGPNAHWATIPFSFLSAWVFITMEMIGDYSENPFEGLYNDVPITNISTGIEIDIRQMLEEVDLPDPTQPVGNMSILV